MNIPNLLTAGRILIVPVIVGIYYAPKSLMDTTTAHGLATAMFVLAAITDWLDGWLARRLKQESAFGAFADPLADKILVAVTLILLVHAARLHAVVAMVIIGREIAISGLREWMAQMGKRDVVAVSMVGKVKTTLQLVGLPLLMCDVQLTPWLMSADAGVALTWGAAVLAIWSMCEYGAAAWRSVKAAKATRSPAGKQMVTIRGNAA